VNKNVLYLSYDGLTDPLGQSQILPYLCGLSKNGYSITIISFEKEERYKQERHIIEKICAVNNLSWSPLKYHKRPPVFSALYDLWYLRKKSRSLHREKKFQIVHCRSYITSLVGLWMKKTYHVKFIFDMRGFWADERVDGGLWNLKNPLYKIVYGFFKRKEKEFLQNANHIISLTENAKNEIISWGLNTSTISVIPTCADFKHFDPELIPTSEKETLRSKLSIKENDFVLLYLGSLGTWYMVREMLDFFSVLKKSKLDAKFLIVSPDQPNLEDYIYSSDVIVQKASRNQIPLFISISNASVFFIRPSFSKKASSATKMAELLAMEIPLITNRGWGDVEYLENLLPGITLVSEGYYVNAVSGLEKNVTKKGIRARAESYFSLAHGVVCYHSIYQNLLSVNNSSIPFIN
jgi:glycosyltransferase involved in cell wall biosynthesis